jgi:hypothetical protein
VQGLLSLQFLAAPGTQTPPEQTSPVVQAFPSLQTAELLVNTQPIAGSQESSVQTLLSLQLIGVWTQLPVAVLQVSVVQALLSLQMSAAPLMQTPPEQTSPVVQAFPSLQAAALLVNTQPVAGLQASSVQTLVSLQLIGIWIQLPVAGSHVSVVQRLLSLHTTAKL